MFHINVCNDKMAAPISGEQIRYIMIKYGGDIFVGDCTGTKTIKMFILMTKRDFIYFIDLGGEYLIKNY